MTELTGSAVAVMSAVAEANEATALVKCIASVKILLAGKKLTTLLRPPSREGLLAFGNRSFMPSALNPPLAPQTKYLPR